MDSENILPESQGRERFIITRNTRHHKVRISHADYIALQLWSVDKDDTIVNITHRMIVQALKCREEHHEEKIAALQKQLEEAREIIHRYERNKD